MDTSGTGPFGKWSLEILDPSAAFLQGTEGNITSQFGENGLIRALFDKIGETNRWCFDCGAADGVWLSNTKPLRDDGWSALLVEANDNHFANLANLATEKVHCVRQKASGDDLDRLLKRTGAPVDLDFGEIDVDGQDWHLWNHLKVYRPRVMMVEYNPSDDPVPPEGKPGEQQAGLTAILELGRKKGYVPLARTNVNAIFCRSEIWDDVDKRGDVSAREV